MSHHKFTPKSFDFFEELAANNDRDWFQTHKDDFQTYVEAPFLDLLEDLSERLQNAKIPIQGSKKTMFRMNRDVRFSKDKSPYKTSIAAVLTPSGTKKESGGLLYVHMDRSGGFAGTGWHNLSPKALGPFRDAMVDDPDAFTKVRKTISDAGRALQDDNSLTTMPRGYSEHDTHPHADAIKLKSLLLAEDLPKVAFTSGDVADRICKLARDAMPFLEWGRDVCEA